MKRALVEFARGLGSLMTGMRITLQQFFKRDVTVRYPHEALKMPARYRGHVVLVRDPATGKSLCVACKSCQKACPSECIVVEGVKREGEKKKSVTEFTLDFTRCSLCGSCVEVCPADALEFSKEYNLASTRRSDFDRMDLVPGATVVTMGGGVVVEGGKGTGEGTGGDGGSGTVGGTGGAPEGGRS